MEDHYYYQELNGRIDSLEHLDNYLTKDQGLVLFFNRKSYRAYHSIESGVMFQGRRKGNQRYYVIYANLTILSIKEEIIESLKSEFPNLEPSWFSNKLHVNQRRFALHIQREDLIERLGELIYKKEMGFRDLKKEVVRALVKKHVGPKGKGIYPLAERLGMSMATMYRSLPGGLGGLKRGEKD